MQQTKPVVASLRVEYTSFHVDFWSTSSGTCSEFFPLDQSRHGLLDQGRYWVKATIDIGPFVEISPAFIMSKLKIHAQTIVAFGIFLSSRQSPFCSGISAVCKKVADCLQNWDIRVMLYEVVSTCISS